MELIRTGAVDAALVRLPIDRTGLHTIPLYTETTVAVVPKEHLVTAGVGLLVVPHAGPASTTALRTSPTDPRRSLRATDKRRVGQLLPGARSDLLLVDGNPLIDLAVLAEPADHLRTVVQDGAVVLDRR